MEKIVKFMNDHGWKTEEARSEFESGFISGMVVTVLVVGILIVLAYLGNGII